MKIKRKGYHFCSYAYKGDEVGHHDFQMFAGNASRPRIVICQPESRGPFFAFIGRGANTVIKRVEHGDVQSFVESYA